MKLTKKICLIVVAIIITTAFLGCTKNAFDKNQIDEDSIVNNVSEFYLIQNDNRFDYQPGLECSAFASAYLLRHFGEEADGLELFENFPDRLPDGNGAYPSGIENFFNERDGYSAEFKKNGTVEELKKLVSNGVPVIVFIHVEEPYTTSHNTHYIPLVGYDDEYFYFAESLEYLANCKDEPNLGYNRKIEISKFERLWSNIDSMWDYPYYIINKD